MRSVRKCIVLACLPGLLFDKIITAQNWNRKLWCILFCFEEGNIIVLKDLHYFEYFHSSANFILISLTIKNKLLFFSKSTFPPPSFTHFHQKLLISHFGFISLNTHTTTYIPGNPFILPYSCRWTEYVLGISTGRRTKKNDRRDLDTIETRSNIYQLVRRPLSGTQTNSRGGPAHPSRAQLCRCCSVVSENWWGFFRRPYEWRRMLQGECRSFERNQRQLETV